MPLGVEVVGGLEPAFHFSVAFAALVVFGVIAAISRRSANSTQISTKIVRMGAPLPIASRPYTNRQPPSKLLLVNLMLVLA